MSIQQISLYYKDGTSDKVYHAQIETKDDGFVVNFQYGRRGGNLAAGTKTNAPVDIAKAKSVLALLLKEKTAKGYTEGENGAVFQSKTFEDRVTGIVPQLLNDISETDLEKYFRDDSFIMQEKKDGKRIIVKSENNKITAINKKGLETLIPQCVCDLILGLQRDCIVDGELIGEKYHIFDLLALDGKNFKDTTCLNRYKELKKLKLKEVVPAYFTYKDKKEAFEKLEINEKEGAVFKKDSSLYISGRPASGGNQLKFKFYATGTFEVYAHHKTKNSVFVCAYDNGKQVNLGKVTIYNNFKMPPVGSFVEVQYLYCFIGGALYQSIYLGERDDQDRTDCTVSQIKFKAKDEDED